MAREVELPEQDFRDLCARDRGQLSSAISFRVAAREGQGLLGQRADGGPCLHQRVEFNKVELGLHWFAQRRMRHQCDLDVGPVFSAI